MRIIIELRDDPESGQVIMECTPSITELVAKRAGGHPISKAESVALLGLARMVESSKEADRKGSRLEIPRSPLILS